MASVAAPQLEIGVVLPERRGGMLEGGGAEGRR